MVDKLKLQTILTNNTYRVIILILGKYTPKLNQIQNR